MSKYISCADTAKLVRQALKAAFPKIKFSVRSKTYSGGASMNIDWTDGPTEYDVKQVIGKFQGASFDGMIDLKSYHTSEWEGEQVHFGADFIFCQRSYTIPFITRRAIKICDRYCQPMPEIYDEGFGAHVKQDYSWTSNGRYTLADLIWQEANKTRSC